MKILILGATGPTGRHLVDLALRSGDWVTALVRDPAALGEVADRFTVVMGDATSQRDVAVAALGQDAVISALGQGRSLNPRALFDRASAAVIGAARQQKAEVGYRSRTPVRGPPPRTSPRGEGIEAARS